MRGLVLVLVFVFMLSLSLTGAFAEESTDLVNAILNDMERGYLPEQREHLYLSDEVTSTDYKIATSVARKIFEGNEARLGDNNISLALLVFLTVCSVIGAFVADRKSLYYAKKLRRSMKQRHTTA